MEASSCTTNSALTLAAALNRDCRCMIVDEPALARGLASALSEESAAVTIRDAPATVFSSTAVFLARDDVRQLRAIIAAIEKAVAMPAYQSQALSWADPVAHFEPGPHGACMGYDFHLDVSGPKLIEINTNAGGMLLNAVLARAARTCCKAAEQMAVGSPNPGALDDMIWEMFRSEWRAQRGEAPLRTIAIVDDAPESQYLKLEFRLFQELFARQGLKALIADASTLVIRNGQLHCGDTPIDLVYNRLTDFSLAEANHAALRNAYASGAVVVTPNPHVYSLFADKRNLTLLTDPVFLQSLRLPADVMATVAGGIPQTLLVTPERAQQFWTQRRQWFFKPFKGFGGRAAYRGDKLTKRVFEEIAQGGYVAQARVEPAQRANPDADTGPLKYDLRCYVYRGDIQLIAARLYQGQTTNFRTPGGGFAPVFYARPDT